MSRRMPALFIGHGSPMNAIQKTRYSDAWQEIGASIPRPSAILCISAHWYVPETAATAMPRPRTIHDFGGFPRELFEVEYPAPGSIELAERVREVLAPIAVRLDQTWGLDHGAWSVLRHVYPGADIPVVQLAIDRTQPGHVHYEIGRKLAPLRDENALICGSGNIVHNLQRYGWGREVAAFDWARRFDEFVRDRIVSGDHEPLVEFESLGPDAELSIPTPEHYLPLLYVMGSTSAGEPVGFPVEGYEGGSLSMRSVRVG